MAEQLLHSELLHSDWLLQFLTPPLSGCNACHSQVVLQSQHPPGEHELYRCGISCHHKGHPSQQKGLMLSKSFSGIGKLSLFTITLPVVSTVI